MNCYGPLAGFYDRLTADVDYPAFADRYEAAFREESGEFRLLLDLCCGTGSMSLELSRRGYEMIAVDASADMLMQAREKCAGLALPPLFLQQDAAELDLYGTVDACVCSLEGINYLSPGQLQSLCSRLRLFIRPGGLFLFDIRSPEFLQRMDGSTSLDEDDRVFCLWRADYDSGMKALIYGMDLFSRQKSGLWRRSREEHVEYAHSVEYLLGLLRENGFSDFRAEEAEQRLHIRVRREQNP